MRFVAGALLAVVLPACSLTSVVRSHAAQDFSCPEGRVHTEESADGGAVQAEGCGREAIYLRGAIRLGEDRSGSPFDRAAFDLSCPATQLRMTYLGSDSIGVEGCSRKASYGWVDGAWVGTARQEP